MEGRWEGRRGKGERDERRREEGGRKGGNERGKRRGGGNGRVSREKGCTSFLYTHRGRSGFIPRFLGAIWE